MHNARYRILLVGNGCEGGHEVTSLLRDEGYSIAGCGVADAERIVADASPHLVLCDVEDGVAALSALHKRWPELPLLAFAVECRAARVVRALRAGASHFVSRSDPAELAKTVRRELSRCSPAAMAFETSPRMRCLLDMVERVADTDVTVLVRGESGAGKEWVAERLYARSRRSQRAFVKVNCAALPSQLLESELFGFERGAFTGAHRRKLGKFELAHGGTLFLDEISEMAPALQAKLLQVLQDGRFARLGAEHDVEVDVRIVAATNRDLEAAVAAGTFRRDLLYRLNVVALVVPPLRARREEVPGLADQLLRHLCRNLGRPYAPLSPELLRLFLAYPWPGNVRELENVLKRRVVLDSELPVIDELRARLRDAPATRGAVGRSAGPGNAALDFETGGAAKIDHLPLKRIGKEATALAERLLIERVLERTCWNRRRAAEILQVSYKALLYKMKDAGLGSRA